MSNLIMGFNSTGVAGKAIDAMSIGSIAFEKYFNENHHLEGSEHVQARFNHSSDHRIPLNDIARSEFANGIALLSNTVPNAFWLLYHLYSDPEILETCRQEVCAVLKTTRTPDSPLKTTLDILKVKTSCPVLLSTYKEVLRLYSTAVSARLVMQDHMLDKQYLLKKGSTVMMPTPVQHHNPTLWGSDSDTFDHMRFADQHPNQAGFRAFGGGTTLCPGRHFATTEILAFAASMIVRFDVRPKGGRWVEAVGERVEFWEATKSPGKDFEVEIRGFESEENGGRWTFVLSDSEESIGLGAEDLE